jgi:hypothetical protein
MFFGKRNQKTSVGLAPSGTPLPVNVARLFAFFSKKAGLSSIFHSHCNSEFEKLQ